LVRPEVLVALPVLLWLAWRRRSSTWPARGAVSRPSDPALLLLVGFVVVALPWWVHHARAVGSPFFNLTSYTLIGFWKGRPDVSVMQDFSLTPARWPAVLRAERSRARAMRPTRSRGAWSRSAKRSRATFRAQVRPLPRTPGSRAAGAGSRRRDGPGSCSPTRRTSWRGRPGGRRCG